MDRRRAVRRSPSAISRAVRAAVPLGASSLRSWCSSMISALAMWRAASAAKRIISTAPIAKLGATSTLAPAAVPSARARLRAAAPGRSRSCRSRRARPRCTHASAFASAVSGCVKSTTTSALARAPRRASTAEQRVGAAGELHVLGALDRRADRLAHAPGGAGDGDADHAGTCPHAPAGADRPGDAAARRDRLQRLSAARASLVGADRRDRQTLRARTARRRARADRRRRRRRSARSSRRPRGSAGSHSTEPPRRFMRAPVDSSASTMRPLSVLARAHRAPARRPVRARSAPARRRSPRPPRARFSGRVPTYRPTSPAWA